MNKTAAQPGETIENQMADRRIGGVRDSVDERLISLLRRNARMTLTALARELSLSRTAVQARMARLERDRVILGYQARIGAALLLVFLAAATFYFHDFWTFDDAAARQQQTIQFMKNLSMMGAMLFVVANGAGPWSLDQRRVAPVVATGVA